MRKSVFYLIAASLASSIVSACAPVAGPSDASPVANAAVATTTVFSGWYTQQGGSAQLRPCGGEIALQVENGEGLAKRAREFGLQDGDPVYVKVHGTRSGAALRVEGIDQFGSPTPVRDCRMGGMSIQG